MLSALQHLSYMKRRSFYELYESSVAVYRPQEGQEYPSFVILLVMATFVLTALALGNASKAAQQELRQSLGGSFLIGFDYTENNPYLKVEAWRAEPDVFHPADQPGLVEQIREIEGIKECSATVEGLAAFPLSGTILPAISPLRKNFAHPQRF